VPPSQVILGVVSAAAVVRREGALAVGHERECAAWAAMLDALPQRGGVLVVSGEPGKLERLHSMGL
jgi:hypothetical protein